MTTIKDIMKDIGVSNKVLKATKSIQDPKHFNSVKNNKKCKKLRKSLNEIH